MRIFERLRAARQDPPPIQTNNGAKEAGKAAIPAPILEPEARRHVLRPLLGRAG